MLLHALAPSASPLTDFYQALPCMRLYRSCWILAGGRDKMSYSDFFSIKDFTNGAGWIGE
jgi:hypothetical protein